MFKFFKKKLKKWTEKVSEEKESDEKSSKKKKSEKKSRNEEIPLSKKFNVGTQSYEPDLGKLKEKVSEIEKSEEPEEKEEKKSVFKKVTSKIGKTKISEKDFSEYSEDLSMLLLENNVAFEVAEKIIEELKEEIVDKEIQKKEIEKVIKDFLKKILEEILVEPFNIIKKIEGKKNSSPEKPFVILFAGINGTGKTTTLAKLADFLGKKRLSCVFAAADTFRAASIEQIQEHGKKLKVKVISHEYQSDPASVGFDAIKYAKNNSIDIVLVDTAGRMHTSKNLLKEIEKISRVCNPDLKIFIGESITGNDAVEQIKSFDKAIGIDGIILTKADVDEKGGTALSVGYITKKPILFLGTGQKYKDLELFDKKKFLNEIGLD